jgi:zinc transporter, ZIP family
MKTILFILGISILGPIIGSLIGVIKKPSEKFMYNMLAFAGGIMLSIAFLELIPESIAISSTLIAVIGVSIGCLLMYALDRTIPHIHPELCSQEQGCKLKRTAYYLIIGIFLHNFPEGMAIAIGTVSDIKISLVIALAIAIHNIPEGICTSAPYYHVTGKRLKAFLVSSSTIIPIIAGFFIASYVFQKIPTTLIGLIIAATAGLMIYITIDEIIPSCCCKVTDHKTMFSFIIGVIFVILLGLLH